MFPWVEQIYSSIPKHIVFDNYETRSIKHSYFLALLKTADPKLPALMLEFLNANREKMYGSGVNDALPWLMTLYNMRRLYKDADFSSSGFGPYIQTFEMIVPKDLVASQKAIIDGDLEQLKPMLRASLIKLNQTRSETDVVQDNDKALKIAGRMIKVAIDTRDVEALFLTLMVRADYSFIFTRKGRQETARVNIPENDKSSFEKIYGVESDQKFFNNFLSYMVNEHEYVRNQSSANSAQGLKPEVGLSNETAIKRLKDFTEYLKYCSVEFDISINLEKIKKFIKLAKHKQEVRPLSKTQKWELTLTTDEIQFVVNLEHYENDFWESLSNNQKRYLDILTFMCLQGTAPIDTKDIKKTDIRGGRIIKDRSKSGNEFKVDLDPIAEDILIRNDYNLDFTDQTVNGELKHLFVTIFELYRRRYERKNDELYNTLCTQKIKKGDREILKIQHKGLFVELMTGRRSFLTNLGEKADELGIKEIMDKAGHTVISTTLGYIHERQQSKKARGLFGIHKVK